MKKLQTLTCLLYMTLALNIHAQNWEIDQNSDKLRFLYNKSPKLELQTNGTLWLPGMFLVEHGDPFYVTRFEKGNEINQYDINGDPATLYMQYRGGLMDICQGGIYITGIKGKVGIGTNAPTQKLTIEGTGYGYNQNALQVRYTNVDNHAANLTFQHLQLGNNGVNYIVAGNTLSGGSLEFWVNNDRNLAGETYAPNGTRAMGIDNKGFSAFYKPVTFNTTALGEVSNYFNDNLYIVPVCNDASFSWITKNRDVGLFFKSNNNGLVIAPALNSHNGIRIQDDGDFSVNGHANSVTIGKSGGSSSLGWSRSYIGFNINRNHSQNIWTVLGDQWASNSASMIFNDVVGNLFFVAISPNSSSNNNRILTDNDLKEHIVFEINNSGFVAAKDLWITQTRWWADHVFKDDYELLPLEQLKEFIDNNKHLPNIPTKDEVKADGISVADMNARLLEKIEELTLYILELKEENNNIKREIECLQKLIK